MHCLSVVSTDTDCGQVLNPVFPWLVPTVADVFTKKQHFAKLPQSMQHAMKNHSVVNPA